MTNGVAFDLKKIKPIGKRYYWIPACAGTTESESPVSLFEAKKDPVRHSRKKRQLERRRQKRYHLGNQKTGHGLEEMLKSLNEADRKRRLGVKAGQPHRIKYRWLAWKADNIAHLPRSFGARLIGVSSGIMV